MRKFIMLFPTFWTGKTGRDLLAAGNNAQLLALYLLSNPAANYTGVYRLPLSTIAEDLGLEMNQVKATMAAVEATGFARYDEKTKFVWIVESARLQLGELKAADNKVKYVNTEFAKLPADCAFLADYYAKYATMLKLKARADVAAPAAAPAAAQAPAQAALMEEDRSDGIDCDTGRPEYDTEAEPLPSISAAEAAVAAGHKYVAKQLFQFSDVNEALDAYAEHYDKAIAEALRRFLTLRKSCGFESASVDARIVRDVLSLAYNDCSASAQLVIEDAKRAHDYDMLNFQKYADEATAAYAI